MNLSSYLQMPPAPAAPQSLSSSATPGLAAGLRADAGSSTGRDFANIMARQFQRLSPSERPSFAAEAPTQPDRGASAPSTPRASWANNTSSEVRQRLHDDHQQADADLGETQDARDAKRTQQRRDAANAQASQAAQEADATLLAQIAMMGSQPVAAVQGQLTAHAETALSLRTIALSPQMHIITTPSAAPDAQSLTAFAQAMGLDDAAIQKLLGEGAAPATTAAVAPASLTGANGSPLLAGLATASQSAETAAALTQVTQGATAAPSQMAGPAGLPPPNSPTPTPTPTPSPSPTLAAPDAAFSSSSTLPFNGLGGGSDATANATTVSDVPQAAIGTTTALGLAANATAHPTPLGLNAQQMAAIEHLQITISAPPAPMTPVVSTVASAALSAQAAADINMSDTVSLTDTHLSEQNISDVLSAFSPNTANEDGAQQQSSSGQNHSQGFAQAMTSAHNAIATPLGGTSFSASASASAAVATTPMGEVYDQLSDKMATEMAARMHKQLSDGEWKMKFGLRPAHLGGVEIQLEMKDGKLDAVFIAENPLTRDLLQNSSQRLRDALENFGIHAGQVQIGQDGANAQQNASRGASKPPQVGDNSSLQVKGSDEVANATDTRNKANASLLDLYA